MNYFHIESIKGCAIDKNDRDIYSIDGISLRGKITKFQKQQFTNMAEDGITFSNDFLREREIEREIERERNRQRERERDREREK